MTTELQRVEAEQPSSSAAVLQVIAAAASNPKVDVDKMRALLEMQERIMAREAEIAFTEAMSRVQNSVPAIVKNRKIIVKGTLRSKYAALEDIDRVMRPLIIGEGFSLSYTTEDVPPKATKLILTVKHRLGHKEPFSLVLPIDNNEFRSASQNASSTVSFGRRILLGMAFNIVTVDEDRDGNPTGDFINENQVLNIVDLLKQIGLREDDQKFLAWAGADKIEHIQLASYSRVVGELSKRLGAK